MKYATGVLTEGEKIQHRPNKDAVKIAYIDRGRRLRSLAEKAEDSSQFRDIYTLDGKVSVELAGSVRNFLRRSRFYLKAFNGEQQSPHKLFAAFKSVRFHKQLKATSLTVLDDVAFASRVLDFGTFKIQKFSRKDLDILTEREVNEVFYPFARVNTALLNSFWLLVEDRSRDLEDQQEPAIEYDDWAWAEIKPAVPILPIQLLAVHRWTPDLSDDDCVESYATDLDEIRKVWPGFVVGPRLTFNHEYDLKPYSNPEIRREISWLELPFNVPISKHQEAEIGVIVEKGQRLLRIVESVKPRWDFIKTAMEYIGKAFLSKPDLEQLLWYIAVLDCLLSEKAEVTQTIRRRIGNILGGTEQERKEVRKQFADLYDFRSDLVHGNTFKKKAQFDHLAKARDFAREVMGWFLDYLLWVDNDLRQREIGYEHYPRRDELLYVLDFDRAGLNRLNRFIGRLPATFPKF